MPLASILARPQFTAPEHEAELELPDGRRLSYATFGARAGAARRGPRRPGSRGLARAAAAAAAQLGVRLVAPDRPGFAGSTQVDGDRIAAWPARSRRAARRARRPARGDRRPVRRHAIRARRRGRARRRRHDGARARRADGPARRAGDARLERHAGCAAGRCSAAGSVAAAPRAGRRRPAGGQGSGEGRREDRRRPAAARRGDHARPGELGHPPARDRRDLRAARRRRPRDRPPRAPVEHRLRRRSTCPWRCGAAIATRSTRPPHARRIAELLHGAPVHVVAGAGTFGLMAHYGDALRFAAQLD